MGAERYEIMKKQRTSLGSGRKKGLRLAAVLLAFCLLVTSDPDIAETASSYVQAAGDDAAAGKPDAGQGVEGTGSKDSAGGEVPGGDGTQTPGNGDGGSAGDGNDAGGTETPGNPEGGDGEETPENPEGGDGTETPGNPEGGDGEETPGNPEGGNGEETPGSPDEGDSEETPGNPEGGDGEETPGNPEGGDGEETPGSPDEGDGEETPGSPDEGDGEETPGNPEDGENADDTPRPEEERDALADIDIDALPETEEAWDAYLESLDEETRAIEEPMEVFGVRTFEAVVPAEVQYAGTDGFEKRHKMRVVWVNDPEHALAKTALSSNCAKSYVCVRVPDKGGSQVRKCYFNKDILTDKM